LDVSATLNAALHSAAADTPNNGMSISSADDTRADLDTSGCLDQAQIEWSHTAYNLNNGGCLPSTASESNDIRQLSTSETVNYTDSKHSVGNLMTVLDNNHEMKALLQAGGWSPSDIIVSIYYIAVDFEYRR
jgi:hypothetical protein